MLTDDDGRTTDACLYYKLTYEPSGSGELNKIYVAANVMNIYAKFQLHPPYGFWEEDFWIFFFENLAFWLPWQPIKISDLDEIHTVGRGLLQNHFRFLPSRNTT